VLAHHGTFQVRVVAPELPELQTEFKSRAHPGRPENFVAVDFPRQLIRPPRRRDRDHGVGMRVVDMFAGDKGVQRRVDRRRPRIKVERAVRVKADHPVFNRGLHAPLGCCRVNRLETFNAGQVEGRKVPCVARPQVAARTFDPQHFDLFSRQRIALDQLAGCVAAAGVRDPAVVAEDVGAVNQPLQPAHRGRPAVVPVVVDMLEALGTCHRGHARLLLPDWDVDLLWNRPPPSWRRSIEAYEGE
jgi:hypothetical protein